MLCSILGNIPINNDRIFEFLMELHVSIFTAFMEIEKTTKSLPLEQDEDNNSNEDEPRDMALADFGEDASDDLLQLILQYHTKFLICHVETKGEKQSIGRC